MSSTLRRQLTLRDLVVFGLLFIGPLAPVGVHGVLDARANGAVALVYLLATLAMACTAWSYAQLSRAIPQAGSVFAYATGGLGRVAGFAAGWMVMLDYLLIPAVACLFSGIALHALVPSVPAWIFTLIAFVATTVTNLAGITVAARAARVVLVCELVVLAVLLLCMVVALATHGAERALVSPLVGVDATGPAAADIAGAISIAVLSFLGFDAIASFAEESAGDPRQVGTAIILCLVGAGLIFVAQTYGAALLSTATPEMLRARPEAQGTAFYDVVRGAIGPWLATVLALTKAVGAAFAAMTAQAAAGRLLFGMARAGRLPRALARIDERRGTPTVALLVCALLTMAVALWAAQQEDGLSVLVSVVDIGALTAFTLLHASVVGWFVVRKHGTQTMAHWLVPLVGAAITIWVLLESGRLAQQVGMIWAAVGAVVLLTIGRAPDDS